jgi:hypothetical protein
VVEFTALPLKARETIRAPIEWGGGGRKSQRACLDVLEKRKIALPYRNSNPEASSPHCSRNTDLAIAVPFLTHVSNEF